ncbi:MAG: prenyltransferase [Lautropia sp.]
MTPPSVWVRAVRPGFLVVTAAAVLVGFAAASRAGMPPSPMGATLTMLGALGAHAAANVLNDVHDARNGGDALNVDRIAPFTGGSRLIQDGVLDAREMARLGAWLAGIAAAIGAWLALSAGAGLLGFVAAGALLGWGYSAPPLALMTRGLGELAVGAGWWLVALGSAWVALGRIDALAVAAPAGYALLVAAILVVNQLPDRSADAAVGKRNWVVRLPPSRARWIHPVLAVGAHALVVGLLVAGRLPPVAVWSLVSLPLALFAARASLADASVAARPGRLRTAIVATIAATILHGVAMAAALALGPG